MNRRSVISTGATLLVASMALTACGTRGGDSGGSGDAGGSGDKVVKIGVISPLSGDLSALGLGIQHSVELAAKQANESGDLGDWKIEVAPEDDEGKPEVGKNAASKLASDKDVIGVVGTLNSSVAGPVQPILDKAKITMVSPANTNPTLTRGAKPVDAPARTYDNYFRTCTTDDVQGPFAARYLYEKAGIKELATVHDKKTYGQGLVDAFSAEYKKLGGKIVAAETINPDEDKFSAVVSSLKAKKPKAVYYGGEYPQAAPLSQQMKAGGLDVPLMGGDGIFSGEYIKLAGKGSAGDLATSVGAPTESLEAGKKFLDDYKAAGYSDPAEAYGAYAYDAATAIINAMKVSLKDAETVEDARQATIDAMKDVSFDGVTGKVAFDEYGDTKTRILTVYEVKGGAWKDVNTEEFK
ncbi:branched-chain amino acid ABC transporter substrate-binding protein [Janibacter sp. Soil728]|uniref:branched-chain amino acid ABC transporter substrate-binding protein n=1 Tax=Janibacter sp. Soil728 TaxID=1736393 RepID=UPI000701AB37|nr:branched-chain amino acid ABC transporter substrate-binding protein [Janibacter sp. Soil728]KRE37139.1 branched-chain amino acid ABC transporter substrate-binding protein [Janibacter sp. Soil728]